jgi:hypothetical protein
MKMGIGYQCLNSFSNSSGVGTSYGKPLVEKVDFFGSLFYDTCSLTFKRPSLNTSRSPYGPTLNSAFSFEAYAFG